MITIKRDYWSLFRLNLRSYDFLGSAHSGSVSSGSIFLAYNQLDFLLPRGDLEVIFFSFVFLSVGLSAGANFTVMAIPAISGQSYGIFFFSPCWLIHLWMTVLITQNLNYSERRLLNRFFNLWQFRVERYTLLSDGLTIIL